MIGRSQSYKVGSPAQVAAASRGVTLIELLIVIAIIAIMLGLLLPAIHLVHQHSLRTACDSNVHQLSIAVSQYSDLHREFVPEPPKGDQPGGWTIAILPFIEETELANRFRLEQSLTSPTNLAAARSRPPIFTCPATPEIASTAQGIGVTNYVLVVDAEKRTQWRKVYWTVKDAAEGSRYPWSSGPELLPKDAAYPAPHPTAFGF